MIIEDNTLVRFVVPTLAQNLQWLELCIASIHEQPVGVDIVVVAPAGANLEYLEKHYNVRVVVERGRSLSEALNQGFESLGPEVRYLGWLGDDDVLAPGSLALTVGALENSPAASLVLGRLRYIDGDGQSMWVVRSGRWAAAYARVGRNFMGQPGSLMRRQSFERVGGIDVSLKNSMDQDLFLKLAQKGQVIYIPKELGAFRVHASSISSTKGIEDESTMVSSRYTPHLPWGASRLLTRLVRISDRLLLSTLCRIPHASAPERNGKPYFIDF